MKYLALTIFTLTLVSVALISCKGTKNAKVDEPVTTDVEVVDPPVPTEETVAAKKAQGEIKGIYGTWRLLRINDPYVGEWQDYEGSKVITIREDGIYTEKTTDNPLCEGKYEVQEGDMLAVTHSCNKAVLMYKVVSTKDSNLILGIQGRHGMVQHEYRPSR